MTDLAQDLRPYMEIALMASTALYAASMAWFRGGMRRLASSGSDEGSVESGEGIAVSVVIAARNEAEHISACLESVCNQSYPASSYEIIVVDDNSSDGTAATTRGFADDRQAAGGPPVRLLSAAGSSGGGSKKAALGMGIAAARGEVIITTDADCTVGVGWVEGAMRCFDDGDDVGMVVGFSQIGARDEVSRLRWAWEAVDFFSLMMAAAGSAGRGHALAASGQNLAFSKRAFDEVGGYGSIQHCVSGDDVLLLQLIRRQGTWRIAFCTHTHAATVHPPTSSWRHLLSQRIRWASNAPYQLHLNKGFFLYLCGVLGASLMLAASPVLVLGGAMGGGVAAVAWAMKVSSEAALLSRGAALFDRWDLMRYLPLWSLTQPYGQLLVGVLGTLGRFTWKDRPSGRT